MSQAKTDLSVRQHLRQQCDLAARARLVDADAAFIKLAPLVSRSPGVVDLRVIDTSRGGLGLSSAVYLPPGTRLLIALSIDNTPAELSVRVQRVRMTDRKPTYYVGTSFHDTTPEQAALIATLLAQHAQQAGGPRA
jgi:PilZ domain